MTMPTMIYENTRIPVLGDVWWWGGFEGWKVIHIGDTDDVWGNISREYIVVINLGNNQLRTVWMRSFLRRWTYEENKY